MKHATINSAMEAIRAGLIQQGRDALPASSVKTTVISDSDLPISAVAEQSDRLFHARQRDYPPQDSHVAVDQLITSTTAPVLTQLRQTGKEPGTSSVSQFVPSQLKFVDRFPFAQLYRWPQSTEYGSTNLEVPPDLASRITLSVPWSYRPSQSVVEPDSQGHG